MHKSQRLYAELQRLYALSCRGYMLSCRGYIHKLQRLYAGYSDNKANSAQFQLGLGLSLAKKIWGVNNVGRPNKFGRQKLGSKIRRRIEAHLLNLW